MLFNACMDNSLVSFVYVQYDMLSTAHPKAASFLNGNQFILTAFVRILPGDTFYRAEFNAVLEAKSMKCFNSLHRRLIRLVTACYS